MDVPSDIEAMYQAMVDKDPDQLLQLDDKLSLFGKPVRRRLTRYKNHVTIRRDLRRVWENFQTIERIVGIAQSQQYPQPELHNLLSLTEPLFVHAVTLYARWFKAAQGATRLDPRDFFAASSPGLATHDWLIDLRDTYIAHRELDTLGADRVYAVVDRNRSCARVKSYWLERPFGLPEGQTFSDIYSCVSCVRDKIDAELLPGCESSLTAAMASDPTIQKLLQDFHLAKSRE